MSKSFDDVMASAKNGRRRTTETVCFSPDLAEQYQAHVIAASAAKAADDGRDPEAPTNRRSGDDPRWMAELKAAQKLVEDNPDSFYDIVLEQLPKAEWLRLLTAHMPRDGHPEDDGRYNAASFPSAALEASLIDPEPNDERIAYFESVLSAGEWDRLAVVIWNLNKGARSVPKADQLSSILSAFGNS